MTGIFSVFSAQSDIGRADEEGIAVPDGYKLELMLHVKGEQIFLCVSGSGSCQWKWQIPNACLFGRNNKFHVGSHGVGSTWSYKYGSGLSAIIVIK